MGTSGTERQSAREPSRCGARGATTLVHFGAVVAAGRTQLQAHRWLFAAADPTHRCRVRPAHVEHAGAHRLTALGSQHVTKARTCTVRGSVGARSATTRFSGLMIRKSYIFMIRRSVIDFFMPRSKPHVCPTFALSSVLQQLRELS